MKKILTILFFLISIASIAQGYPITQKLGSVTTNVHTDGTLSTSTGFTFTTVWQDTTTANSQSYIKYTAGMMILTADNTLWTRNPTASQWVAISGGGGGGGVTAAQNGTSLVSTGVVGLGGSTITQYTPITLASYPIKYIQNGIKNSTQNDSNAVHFSNFSTPTTSLDSMITPSIIQSIKSKVSIGSTVKTVQFRTDVIGSGNALGQYRIMSSTDGGAYTYVFRILSTGFIPDNLNLAGNYIGIAGTATNNFRWGATALNATTNSAVSGGNMVAIGTAALSAVTSGNQNVAIGTSALSLLTTGVDNTAVGVNAGATMTTPDFNTAIGSFALSLNTTGNSNTAVGKNALLANTTAIKNTAVGAGAMEATTTGGFNTAIGEDAMLHNILGTNNSAIGWLAGSLNVTGSNNVSIGWSSARGVAYQNNSVFVGMSSGYLTATGAIVQEDSCYNCIALGTYSYTDASNQMRLGNDSLTSAYMYGLSQGAGTKVVRYNPSTHQMFYIDTTANIGTLQQVLTAGSTLTTNNTIDNTGHTLSITGNNAIFSINDATGLVSITNQRLYINTSTGGTNGLYIENLTNLSTQDRLLGMAAVAPGQVGWITVGAGLSLSGGTLTSSGGAITWNNISNPTGSQTLSFDDGEVSTWTNGSNTETFLTLTNNSLTTGSVVSSTTNSITTGNQISLVSTSTALAAGNEMLDINVSGANGTNAITATGARISVTNTNATSGTNVALALTASGATTGNYALTTTGRVGIETTTPGNALDVNGTAQASGFTTTGTVVNANLGTAATTGTASTTSSPILYPGGSNTAYRLINNGTTASTLTAGHDFANFVGAGGAFTEAGSSTHPRAFGAYVRTPTITNGAGATDTTGALYLSAESTGITEVTGRFSLLANRGNAWFKYGSVMVGVAGEVSGLLKLNGSTSGTVTITPTATAGTPTLTLPAVTGTMVQYSESSTASSATPSPTGDARENFYDITALATNPTFAAPSGTPANHNTLLIRILDNGTSRTISWNSAYLGGTQIALPTATTINVRMYAQFIYNSTSAKWELVGLTDGIN